MAGVVAVVRVAIVAVAGVAAVGAAARRRAGEARLRKVIRVAEVVQRAILEASARPAGV